MTEQTARTYWERKVIALRDVLYVNVPTEYIGQLGIQKGDKIKIYVAENGDLLVHFNQREGSLR